MNIPVGTLRIQGRRLASISMTKDIIGFMERNSIGYFCITTKGKHGIQEGLLIVENGLLVGSHYEYLSLSKNFNSKEALKRSLNAFFAKTGVYDSYELTVQQIELLKIFNEDMLFLEPIDSTQLQGMIPATFTQEYEDTLLKKTEKNKREVLKEHGLTQVEIDNYQRIKDQIKPKTSLPKAAEAVEGKVNAYLSGKPIREEAPKEQPKIEEEKISRKIVLSKPPPPPKGELGNLDEKASQLLKKLEKGGKDD